MKQYCETCNAKGREVVCISKPGVRGFECIDKGVCTTCSGLGYTEVEVIPTSEILTAWDLASKQVSWKGTVKTFENYLKSREVVR